MPRYNPNSPRQDFIDPNVVDNNLYKGYVFTYDNEFVPPYTDEELYGSYCTPEIEEFYKRNYYDPKNGEYALYFDDGYVIGDLNSLEFVW